MKLVILALFVAAASGQNYFQPWQNMVSTFMRPISNFLPVSNYLQPVGHVPVIWMQNAPPRRPTKLIIIRPGPASNNIAQQQQQPARPGQFAPVPSYQPGQPITKPDIIHEEAKEHGSSPHFGYSGKHGPEEWAEDYPACGGSAQSPIDFNVNEIQQERFNPLEYLNYWTQPSDMSVVNNGHSLEVTGNWPAGKVPSVRGGPLTGEYQFKQMHLHWGQTEDAGSEHTVNGQSFPMEMHIVHWKKQYGTYDNALKHPDGLTVLGYLFQMSEDDNPMLQKFIDFSNAGVAEENKKVKISTPLALGILNVEPKNWFYYKGSLTTPPCLEIVQWLVSTDPIPISKRQRLQLSSVVRDEHGDHIENFRPTQPLNGRPVYLNV